MIGFGSTTHHTSNTFVLPYDIQSKITRDMKICSFFMLIINEGNIIIIHPARRPRTSRGRLKLGPYVSFTNVLIRRGRRKDVASTSRPNRTYNYVLRTPGRERTSGKHMGSNQVVLSTSRPNKTYYGRPLPSGNCPTCPFHFYIERHSQISFHVVQHIKQSKCLPVAQNSKIHLDFC